MLFLWSISERTDTGWWEILGENTKDEHWLNLIVKYLIVKKMRIRLREQHRNIIYPDNMEMMLLSKMEGKRMKNNCWLTQV